MPGGWKGVFELKRIKEQWRSDERILGDGNFVTTVLKESEEELNEKERLKRSGWDIGRIVVAVSNAMSVRKEDMFRKGRDSKGSRAKMIVKYFAANKLGMSATAIARYFGVTKAAAIKNIRKGELLNKEYILDEHIK